MILAGDVGGTKTNLALFDGGFTRKHLVHEKRYENRRDSGLCAILEQFLPEGVKNIEAASFGIAGPVIEGRVEATNLPWTIDSSELRDLLEIKRVGLINDLVATAYGSLTLDENEILTLHKGIEREGTRAIIAAGTGLGEAFLLYDEDRKRFIPGPSEGGHCDFAPRNELEIDLLRFMMKKYKRVSYERVLSGNGLYEIYRFLLEYRGESQPEWLHEEMQKADPSAVISRNALDSKCKVCSEALDVFVDVYGAETGNLALQAFSLGGIYIGGGIAPKIRERIEDERFLQSYLNKGRFSDELEQIPLRLILDDKTALRGAAFHGYELSKE